MGNEFQLISTDAQRALEEFSMEFAAALTQPGVAPWARNLGLARVSRALKTSYPIPVSAAGYLEFKGDVKYRSLFEKAIELTPKTWQDGVAELASIIEAPDFVGWTGQPEAMAAAAMSLPNEIIAGLLEANATQDFDGVGFFSNSHPINIFDDSVGTFNNININGAVSVLGLTNAKNHFRSILAPNGKPLGLRLTHIMVPPELEETAKDLLEQDMLIQTVGSSFGAIPNRHKGTVELVVCDELTNATQWYGLALNKPGMYPWIVQDEGTPERIVSDKTSHLYASTLKVGVAYILRGNGGLALPHCMVRMDGSD